MKLHVFELDKSDALCAPNYNYYKYFVAQQPAVLRERIFALSPLNYLLLFPPSLTAHKTNNLDPENNDTAELQGAYSINS